jgi:hypothetical protein
MYGIFFPRWDGRDFTVWFERWVNRFRRQVGRVAFHLTCGERFLACCPFQVLKGLKKSGRKLTHPRLLTPSPEG